MATTNPDEIQLDLTQAEVWDDSTLVEAWDEALTEYKKYHSIAVTGEDKEALMKAVEEGRDIAPKEPPKEEVMTDAPATAPETDNPETATTEEQPVVEEDKLLVENFDVQNKGITEDKAPEEPISESPAPTEQQQQTAFPFAQMHPAGPAEGYAIGGNDVSMRNLMMAWYWAGYYTGLREGQQKAMEHQQQQQQ
ncbi:hypothetical protein FN846DRAFT_908191 [Sphaerosporella brunnea]|uniref:Survival Motor Neuron Gemin2-binding domain-containing protein n=1 Tax=Sphaerosporella brunnea TaxID=1250544 RepID=A0A5J5EU36_9PEZI|nr:hypothetical protein FN846DRAFT_908191 [Sphaerosporella brunnea]